MGTIVKIVMIIISIAIISTSIYFIYKFSKELTEGCKCTCPPCVPDCTQCGNDCSKCDTCSQCTCETCPNDCTKCNFDCCVDCGVDCTECPAQCSTCPVDCSKCQEDTRLPISQLWVSTFVSPDLKYTYEKAKAYCESNTARLATDLDMIAAYNKGFEYCAEGWLDGQKVGYVMQTAKEPSCFYGSNQQGLNVKFDEPDNVHGVYCVGPTLPDSAIKSIVLEYPAH